MLCQSVTNVPERSSYELLLFITIISICVQKIKLNAAIDGHKPVLEMQSEPCLCFHVKNSSCC